VRAGRLRLRPEPPAIPAGVRPAFALAGLAALSSWSIAGLALALGPELAATLFHSSDHLVGSLSVVTLAGPAAISQLAFRNSAPWVAVAAGSIALAIGLLGIVLAGALDSGAVYMLANIVASAGFGAAFLGALRTLARAIPPTRRSSVMSAFYLVAYGSLSVPAILAGALTTPLGLSSTFEIFGALLAAVAFVVATLAARGRPEPDVVDVRGQPAPARPHEQQSSM
jgi:hypothetical protein